VAVFWCWRGCHGNPGPRICPILGRGTAHAGAMGVALRVVRAGHVRSRVLTPVELETRGVEAERGGAGEDRRGRGKGDEGGEGDGGGGRRTRAGRGKGEGAGEGEGEGAGQERTGGGRGRGRGGGGVEGGESEDRRGGPLLKELSAQQHLRPLRLCCPQKRGQDLEGQVHLPQVTQGGSHQDCLPRGLSQHLLFR
jgi:hypothetical protein